jgi:hypothetical protein
MGRPSGKCRLYGYLEPNVAAAAAAGPVPLPAVADFAIIFWGFFAAERSAAALGPLASGRGFQSFTRTYDISYRGLKLPRVSVAFGRCCLRRGADLPQVGSSSDGYSEKDFLDDEAPVAVSGSSFLAGAGLDLLCFPGRTSPRGRGDVRGLWFSPQYRRLCYLPPAGKPGTAGLNFVPATAVLGLLGVLGIPGAVVGAVLALTRGSGLASLMPNFLAEQPNRQCR